MTRPTNVAVLGATGSIGVSTLDVIAHSGGRLRAAALSGRGKLGELRRQAKTHRPRWIVAADAETAQADDWSGLPEQTQLLTGADALCEIAAHSEIDLVVAAIVGSAGLHSTWAALEAGKTVALANKETLVMAGSLATQLAARTGATLLPVDSEHSAVFQALACGRREEVRRIVLTASGGPFRDYSRKQLAGVTVEQALDHPTWTMGPKITIDSATMMNKALELIEARWLFDLPPEQIEVMVHPQSVVHSMVEFIDGSITAQLSPPDMRLPIQYALTYPQRLPSPAARFDWSQPHQLDFRPADEDRFPALTLGRRAARDGGTAAAVLNAANEAAVALFLDRRISFTEIVPACQAVLDAHPYDPRPTLSELLQHDAWARKEVEKAVRCRS